MRSDLLRSPALFAGITVLLLTVGAIAGFSWSSPSALPAPRVLTGAPHALQLTAPSPLAVSAPPTPQRAAGAAALSVHPSAACPPTPNTPPHWTGSSFFNDVQVTFDVPGSPGLSGSNFVTVPCFNTLPTYTNGFWMNISTDVRITQAFVAIWGTTWPTPGSPPGSIPGFTPENVTSVPLHVNGPLFHTASFFFNDYRFFWPGSSVYFNLTVESVNATPSTIVSAQPPYRFPVTFPGGTNNATWMYQVASPWSSTNFTDDIAVSTTPSVLSQPAFEPNRDQALQVILTSLNLSNLSGGPGLPIPMAQMSATVTGGASCGIPCTYAAAFGPANHTIQELLTPIGPYPGSSVQFTITAWLPWQGNLSVDKIVSPVYKFNWTANGGWWYPQAGVEGNLQYTTVPNVFGSSTAPGLSTGTPVNVTVHSSIENVTIGSAQLQFRYSDGSGSRQGQLPFTKLNANTSYVVIPGLPNGGKVTFNTVVKDTFGNPISSGNGTYTESGPLGTPTAAGYGVFFFEAVDLSGTGLVPNLNFTLSNGSWYETREATSLGFGYPLPVGAPGYLPVAYGTYVLTIHAFGVTESSTFTLASGDPFTIVFYVASGPVPSSVTVPAYTLALPAIVGLVAACAATIPITNWFKERRKKAEDEQRRITL
jgi:hypothetical protein